MKETLNEVSKESNLQIILTESVINKYNKKVIYFKLFVTSQNTYTYL